MKVQRVHLADSRISYIVTGSDFLPIKPISSFIRYIDNTDKSIHTIRAYANHLKLYWEYLAKYSLSWDSVSLSEIAGFVGWLRCQTDNNKVIDLVSVQDRKSTTINSILGCLSSFYQFHNHSGDTNVTLEELVNLPGSRYKSLLHHVYKDKPTRRRIISMKQFKRIPETITKDQFKTILAGCCNARDIFLVSLLYQTGLRIGQALMLKHQDILSWDNVIKIQPDADLHRSVQSKTNKPNIIHVSPELMRLYADYMNEIANNLSHDFVFVNRTNQAPLHYSAVYKLFKRLSSKVGFKITPHMFRHTHATQLIQSGIDPALVQKRLGHASIQTTIETYTHIDQITMKSALKQYWAKGGESDE